MYHDLTDYELSQLCKQGDHLAFDTLVRRYQQPLFIGVVHIVQDVDSAKDVVQEAFVKAWTKISLFNPEYKFYSWLYRIAINQALNHTRDKPDEERIRDDHPSFDSPDTLLHENETSASLHRAVQLLPDEQRVVLSMRYFDELNYREIAQILDISEGLVKSRLHAARIKLRNILTDENT